MCCFRLGLIDYSVVEPFEPARRYRKKGGGAPAEEDEEREKQDEETVGQTPVVLFVLFFAFFPYRRLSRVRSHLWVTVTEQPDSTGGPSYLSP